MDDEVAFGEIGIEELLGLSIGNVASNLALDVCLIVVPEKSKLVFEFETLQ